MGGCAIVRGCLLVDLATINHRLGVVVRAWHDALDSVTAALPARASVPRLVDLQGLEDVVVWVHAVAVVVEVRDCEVWVLEGCRAVKGHPVRHVAAARSALGHAVLPLGASAEAGGIVAWGAD